MNLRRLIVEKGDQHGFAIESTFVHLLNHALFYIAKQLFLNKLRI